MKILGDKKPNAYKAFLAFRADNAKIFNADTPDSENVYYQSYAFSMKHDIILWFTHLVIKKIDGENDGLVSVKSAEWGDFKGVVRSNSKRGISHCDEVNSDGANSPKKRATE